MTINRPRLSSNDWQRLDHAQMRLACFATWTVFLANVVLRTTY